MKPTSAVLDANYSDPAAVAVPWEEAVARLAAAELAWVVSVRPDGRPHATPMVPVTHDGRVYFHTGRSEVKARNIAANPAVLVLAGDTAWDTGLDVAVAGVAAEVTDETLLQRLAELYHQRWDGRWDIEVRDGRVVAEPGGDLVMFEVTPAAAHGHSKGDPFGQTNYRFAPVGAS